MKRPAHIAATATILLLLAVFIGLPLAATAFEAFGPRKAAVLLDSSGLSAWARWIRDTWPEEPEPAVGMAIDPTATASLLEDRGGVPRPLRLALESLCLIAATEALVLPPGIIAALLLFRCDVPFRRLMLAFVVLALFIPLPLHATAWLGAFGNAGRAQLLGLPPLLVGLPGAAIIHAVAALPWVILIVGVGVRVVESELEQSASLDMAPWRVALAVTLRRSLGAIAAAAVAVAVLTAGDMTVTDLLQVRTYAEEAYIQFTLGRGPAEAAYVALPPLIVLAAAVLALGRGLEQSDPARLAHAFSRADTWQTGRWRWPLGAALVFAVLGLLLLPLYGLVWRAGRVGGKARLALPPSWSVEGLAGTLRFAFEESLEPIRTGLLLAIAAATVATGLAWGLGWKARRSRRWQGLLLVTIALTLAAPGPVVGMAIGLAYRWFPNVYDTGIVVVMGQVVRALPYAMLILWVAIRALPDELLESSALDGLGPVGVVFRVAVPLTFRAILAAWLATLVLAFGELPATNLLQPPGVTTITCRIWALLHTGVESHLAGVALIMLSVIAAILATAMLTAWMATAYLGIRRRR